MATAVTIGVERRARTRRGVGHDAIDGPTADLVGQSEEAGAGGSSWTSADVIVGLHRANFVTPIVILSVDPRPA
jgi:hypothetical protein